MNILETIFVDAETLYRDALAELERGNLRNASEKAWGATVAATRALVLARTGQEIDGTRGLTTSFMRLIKEDKRIQSLKGRYFTRESYLHGQCFYMGLCEPVEQIEREIRETVDYIRDTRELVSTKQ